MDIMVVFSTLFYVLGYRMKHFFYGLKKVAIYISRSSKDPHIHNEARCTTFHVKMRFYLRENEKLFLYQRLSTYPRFKTKARGNSEMAYSVHW